MLRYPQDNAGGVDGEVVNISYHNQLALDQVAGAATYFAGAVYDAAGRMTQLVRGAPGAGQLTTAYSYYAWAEKATVGGAPNIGQGGRLWQMTTGALQDLRYLYDAVGNVRKIDDHKAVAGQVQTQNFTYDRLYRLISAETTGGTPGVDGSYPWEAYAYDANGRPVGMPGIGTFSYAAAHPHAVEKIDNVQKYWYDPNGNMTTRVVDANSYTLGYDGDNRLTTVSGAATNSYIYNGDGQKVKAVTYENLAFGTAITNTLNLNWAVALTDGDTQAGSYQTGSGEFAYTNGTGLLSVMIDLGAVYSVDKVKVFHYAADGRTYHNTKTEISADGQNWTTIFDSAQSGEYAETTAGKTHTFTTENVRYVRDQLNGNTVDNGNHWVEIEVYGSRTQTFIGGYLEWNGSTANMVKYYYAGAQRIAMRTGSGNGATGLKWLVGDHLGSTSLTVDAANANKLSELRYKPWGELRYLWNTTATDLRFTGQRKTGLGLMEYGARWYDHRIMQFNQPDSLIPDPYNSLDWNRFAYARYNSIRYTDSTGHWSEDQLEDWLGEDWEDYYFGEGGIFEGREELKDFLTDPDVTDLFNLNIIKEFFRLATYLDSLGINIEDYDALGCRFTGMVGEVGIAGANVDAILDLKSGELSYFAVIDGAAGLGLTGAIGAGYMLLKGLPNNNEYLGPGKAFGTSLAHWIGINLEGFSGGLINGNTSSYSGLYVGGLMGESFSLYLGASYTYVEALNVSASGYSFLNSLPDLLTILRELGDMFMNDDYFHFGY